ncbi:carbohydrate ABC transporter permease [Paenibacillus radicis (ex Xue et al. 2023)]|uniref:Sugar ABC transporter permease n=1 Tax=Paenibacillus radicis (ex Xue et al. 2023) TaxID=2972489 RepID=A0ABT1YNL9_9BACL|nr:sugar ABC transporter permease [Paenibacillus radicis (ex Xue et al. 2023)]MCR8634310.1 sugar ABC transporter permease [Paenibacillus radicis (ex Xue et al. 2023)]
MMFKAPISRHVQYGIFLVPALIAYTLFTVYPMVKTFVYSLTNFNGMSKQMAFVGFNNYVQVFRDDAIVSALLFTLFYTFFSVVAITLLAIPLALVLDLNSYTKHMQRAIFFFPSIPSGLLLGYVWGFILSPISSGVANRILHALFNMKAVPWLSDPLLAKISSVIVHVWSSTGWHAILYLAFLQSIPKDYYEAASIDGASRWQKIRFITLPMLAPAMTVSVMLLVTGSLKVFEIPFALTKGGPGYETYTVTQVIITRGVSELQYGKASAMSIIFFLCILLITFVQFGKMQKREENLQ